MSVYGLWSWTLLKTYLEEYRQNSDAVMPAVWAETRHKEMDFLPVHKKLWHKGLNTKISCQVVFG